MADQNTPQNPPAPPVPAPTVAQTVETAATAIVDNSLKGLWNRYGIFFILIAVGIVIVKFGNIATDLLGWSSKKDLEEAQKTDAQLKAKENTANTQADALVQEAKDLPAKEGQADDDWYKKQGN